MDVRGLAVTLFIYLFLLRASNKRCSDFIFIVVVAFFMLFVGGVCCLFSHAFSSFIKLALVSFILNVMDLKFEMGEIRG